MRPASRTSRLARLGALTGAVTVRMLRGGESALADNADQVARSLSRLRGAAMKLGQGLALLADGLELTAEVKARLDGLSSQAGRVPFAVVRRTVEAELDGPLEARFEWFDTAPLGTASLAQAHAARLPDGRPVVVKVLHPGVVDAVEVDLAALKTLLRSNPIFWRRRAEMEAVVCEVEIRLREELDYHHEAANIVALHRAFAGDENLTIPRYHPAWSTDRVLTMDRMGGACLDDFLATASPAARRRAGLTLARVALASTFVHRTLHADPHPGNFRFLPDGRVQLIDFGCVKRFDEFFAGTYARVILAALDGRREGVLAGARALGVLTGPSPEAGEAVWQFCLGVLGPLAQGPVTIGEADDRVARAAIAGSRRMWTHHDIRGPAEILFLHRTLAGTYVILRRLEVRADWGAMLREHAQAALRQAQGLAA